MVNGDVLTDLDTTALVAFHRSHGAAATIHLKAVEDPSRFGVVPTDGDGRVIEFVEKPPAGHVPTNLINAGTYVLEPEVLALHPAGRRVSVERETFPALVAEGTVFAMASDAYWLDTGTPDAYLQAKCRPARRGAPRTTRTRCPPGVARRVDARPALDPGRGPWAQPARRRRAGRRTRPP